MHKIGLIIVKKIYFYLTYLAKIMFTIYIFFNNNSIFAVEWIKITPKLYPAIEVNNFMPSFFINKNEGWFIDYNSYLKIGTIWKTVNGGRIWRLKLKSDELFQQIKFFDSMNGFVLVVDRDSNSYLINNAYILRTSNGGDDYEKIFEMQLPNKIDGLYFLDTLNGFADKRNVIYRTTDGGAIWTPTQIDTLINFSITNIFFVDKNYGWASGINNDLTHTGILLSTIDGGESWQIQIERTYFLYGLFFSDTLNGALAGSNSRSEGKILMTHDGGKSWTTQDVQGPTLFDVEFMDKNNGWAVGLYGTILKTEDGGDNWKKVDSGTEENLTDICFVDNGTVGYIFGSNKTLLKYDSDLRNNGSSNVSVYPNYPNPFMNSTTINYDLWEDDQIEISVFDINGRLVDKLFSGYQEKGIYPVTWHPKNISSGIYFFQIKTSTSLKTNKGLYLK